MESRLGHANKMMFAQESMGKKHDQRVPEKKHFFLSKLIIKFGPVDL